MLCILGGMGTFPVHISDTDPIFYADRKRENKVAIGSDGKEYTFHQRFSGFLERMVGIRITASAVRGYFKAKVDY